MINPPHPPNAFRRVRWPRLEYLNSVLKHRTFSYPESSKANFYPSPPTSIPSPHGLHNQYQRVSVRGGDL